MIDASGRFSPSGTGGVVLFGDVLTTPPVIVVPPPLPEPPPPTEGCTDAICGITDTFDRPDRVDWGTSTSGLVWQDIGTYSGAVASITNGYGSAVMGVDGGIDRQISGFAVGPDYQWSIRFKMPIYSVGNTSTLDFVISTPTSSGFNRVKVTSAPSLRLEWWDSGNEISMTFLADTWYRLKMERVAGLVRAKIWLESGSEPFLWTIEGTQTTELNQMTSFEVNSNNFDNSFSTLVDDLDFTDANRCTEYRFDNFNDRTLVGVDRWGTSSSGPSWSTSDSGESSVEGGYGKLHINGVGQAEQNMASPPPFLHRGQPIAMSTRFKTDVVDIGGGYVQNELVFQAWNGGVGVWFVLSNEPGTGGVFLHGNGGGFFFADFLFTANTWYLARWEQTGAVGQAKVWAEGDTEPDWMASGTVTDTQSGDAFRVRYDDGGTDPNDATVSIDWIDFGYAGKPCFATGCANVFDDFSGRTVTSTWGRASSGPPFDWNDLGNATTFGVSGGFGYADVTGLLALFETYQDVGNTTLPWSGEFTTRLDWAYGSLLAEEYIETAIFVTENTTDQAVECYAYISRITGDPAAVIVKSPGHFTSALIASPPTAPADVHMKWHFVPGGVSEAKVWYNSDPEPGAYQVSFVNAATTLSRDKRLSITSDSASSLVHVTYDQLCFDG